MLDTLNQDYVRTARSKGLTERTVVMRHAFRNALIPVTTLAAYDFGAVIGGAIITEVVFSWRGMGFLFQQNLINVDPNPIMAFYIVTAVSVVVFNMLADIAYAYLDPRIRLS
jgi:peptide/nickel transport system permease protein